MIWWRCGGSSDQLPEIAIYDVLAPSPEAAAIQYATEAHRELAPDEPRVVVDVHVWPTRSSEIAQSGYTLEEIETCADQRVISERRYIGCVEVRS